MQDWIHRYPQVERLLQRDPDEELCYDADTAEVRTPLLGRQIVALEDAAYRRAVRDATREVVVALDGLEADLGIVRAPRTPWPSPVPEDAA
jgi:hypothetical protein